MAPVTGSRMASFGHLFDFANIKLRRRRRNSHKTEETMYTHCNDSDWTFATVSSAKDKYHIVEKGEEPQTVEEGLYIRFASHNSKSHARPLSENRLARLKYRIARAVVAAGMQNSSPDTETSQPFGIAVKALPPVSASSLYSGTYGQVMDALILAGLEAVPCHEAGFEGAAYLGAMFVSRHMDAGIVELTKLTLWA